MGYLHDHKKKTSKELSVPLPTTITFGLFGVLWRDVAFCCFIVAQIKGTKIDGSLTRLIFEGMPGPTLRSFSDLRASSRNGGWHVLLAAGRSM